MGYPMTYGRLVGRNHLTGDYHSASPMIDAEAEPLRQARRMIAGDMRRLERDSRDEQQLKHYAAVAGITADQAKILLDEFFHPHWGNGDFSEVPG